MVLRGDGTPWDEANLWLLDIFESAPVPKLDVLAYLADDLVAFRRFIEDTGIDWLDFPAFKPNRPTYRYRGSLTIAYMAEEVSPSVAKRRMSSVVRFYRWLMHEGVIQPAHAPWTEGDRYIEWTNPQTGYTGVLTIKTTDLAIHVPRADDDLDEYIVDEGRLRPLPEDEQKVLLEVLSDLGNTEMTLAHLCALLTGARIQTVLTLRLRHFQRSPDTFASESVGVNAGPGTGVDTKRGKRGVLHVPKWFYERLHTYALSKRATSRRQRAEGGDAPNQYLFLSRTGKPLYESQETLHRAMSEGAPQRWPRAGQAVRTFIRDYLLPEMRSRLKRPTYNFSFHDLRATFGMNWVSRMAPAIDAGTLTYSQALDQLRQLMWHRSVATTEHYLKHRKTQELRQAAETGWNAHLQQLINAALLKQESSGANR